MNHSNRTLERSLKLEAALRANVKQPGRNLHVKTIKERFYEKVNKHGPVPLHQPELGPCWLWTAKLNKDGYGRFSIREKEFAAYRVSYTLEFGTIEEGFTLDHLCRVRRCIRPSHLEPVTIRVNLLRGDTLQAENFSKTHCVNGHPFDEENTYRDPGGWRQCKICRKVRKKKAALKRSHECS